MMDELVHLPAAVALRVLDLRADLTDRLALPRHLAGGEVPFRMPRNAARLEVRRAVAGGAAQRHHPVPIGAALDRRLVRPPLVSLMRAVARGVTIHAARMGQNL